MKLNPEFRAGGRIRYHKKIEGIKPGQTCIALSKIGSKKYSFLLNILEIVKDDQVTEFPILDVNKNIIGILGKNDEVELFTYNVPGAESITIGLDQDQNRGIVKGDWSASLKEPLQGKEYDIGRKAKAAIEFNKKTLIIRGILIDSYPEAPVKVTNTTKILLDKMSSEELNALRKQIDQKKQSRVDELEQFVKERLRNAVGKAKDKLSMVKEKTEYESADPRMIDHSINQLFVGYEIINQTVKDTLQRYSASRTFAIEKDDTIVKIVEYTVNGSNEHGSVVVMIYDTVEMEAKQQARKLWDIISEFQKGLKEKSDGYDTKCPRCGGTLLIDEIDAEGYAYCKFCRKKSRVKKLY